MAIKMGTENKRQVYLAIGLFVVIIALGIYEFTGTSSTKTNTAPKPAATATQPRMGAAPTHPLPQANSQTSAGHQQGTQSGAEAEKVTSLNIDPALHLLRLSYTESILYEGRGRNIFSADSMPLPEPEVALSTGRPGGATSVAHATPAFEKPTAPPIDLKYFGYMLTKDKTYKAFFVRGDDIFTANTGEIVDHRYKVGTITANSVQLTDLNYNNTQDLRLTGANATGNRE